MRRADRLFQIIQILRRTHRPMTAAALAAELEVSRRTVYRDVTDLIAQRVPIVGTAGLGYLLDASYDMPPLMLTADEIEAVVLGAQWVMGRGDRTLSRAAADVIAKIAAVVPERLRPFVDAPSVGTKPVTATSDLLIDTAALRQAIRDGRKLRLHYRSESGATSERTVWPVILGFSETARLIVAWCELRQDFRHFRTDRLLDIQVLDDRHGLRAGDLQRRWQRWRQAKLDLGANVDLPTDAGRQRG